MSFWWVNHGQTVKVEIEEGYIWSPQRNKDGSRNQSYINLTRTAVGDTVFSYADTKIPAVGKVIAICEDRERPEEFGSTGHQWDKTGWLVRIQWNALLYPFRPKDHLEDIRPLLPSKHSPIQANGNGNQGVYLAEISDVLGNTLLSLIDKTNFGIKDELEDIDTTIIETKTEDAIKQSEAPNTQKQQLILARVGQGLFRLNVEKIESKCRVTGLSDKRLLIASHIKPWKDSTNQERLDGHNGFLLSPHIDKLFDKGWISFSNDGKLIVSTKKIQPVLQSWFIDPSTLIGAFSAKQKEYLDHHRNHIFKG
jgi:hypothetical protein